MNHSRDDWGLPSKDDLAEYRIWDSYFTPAHSHPGADGFSRVLADIQRSLPAIRKGQFEKLCYFPHVGIGTTADQKLEDTLRDRPDTVIRPLKRWPDLLLGMIQLNANRVEESLAAIDRWIANGPMVGACFPGGGPAAVCCTSPNFVPLVRRLSELQAAVVQHTWFKTGGKQHPGESTPAELASLAAKFPDQPFICAHAGGQWQLGIRAVRSVSNVLVETSGFDATAGFLEMAIRELGGKRVVFGSHLPSRSLGTELAKVSAAAIPMRDKQRVFGENFRELLRPILNRQNNSNPTGRSGQN